MRWVRQTVTIVVFMNVLFEFFKPEQYTRKYSDIDITGRAYHEISIGVPGINVGHTKLKWEGKGHHSDEHGLI